MATTVRECHTNWNYICFEIAWICYANWKWFSLKSMSVTRLLQNGRSENASMYTSSYSPKTVCIISKNDYNRMSRFKVATCFDGLISKFYMTLLWPISHSWKITCAFQMHYNPIPKMLIKLFNQKWHIIVSFLCECNRTFHRVVQIIMWHKINRIGACFQGNCKKRTCYYWASFIKEL